MTIPYTVINSGNSLLSEQSPEDFLALYNWGKYVHLVFRLRFFKFDPFPFKMPLTLQHLSVTFSH